MNKKGNSGFSLVEIFLVVVIIGVIAALAVPSLQRGIRAADNEDALTGLRKISTAQLGYYSNSGRFARLDELNTANSGNLGTTMPPNLVRGNFIFTMNPIVPTDAELRETYIVVATKSVSPLDAPYVISVDQTGEIVQILP